MCEHWRHRNRLVQIPNNAALPRAVKVTNVPALLIWNLRCGLHRRSSFRKMLHSYFWDIHVELAFTCGSFRRLGFMLRFLFPLFCRDSGSYDEGVHTPTSNCPLFYAPVHLHVSHLLTVYCHAQDKGCNLWWPRTRCHRAKNNGHTEDMVLFVQKYSLK